MSEGVGPVPTPGQWARVQLAQGHSGAGLWDLSSEVPEARITVGSAPGAGWVVEGPDVAPVHFELFWDGATLWVSPPYDGELTVEGERIQSWRQLVGRSRIEFGRAAFLVETSQTIGMPPHGQALGGHVTRADEVVPDHEGIVSPSMLEHGAPQHGAPQHGVPHHGVPHHTVPGSHALLDDATAAMGPSTEPLEGDATRMVDGAFDPSPPAPSASAPPPGVGRPMLGGQGAPEPAPEPKPFGGALKTQILDTEAAGIDLRPSPVPHGAPAFAPPGQQPDDGPSSSPPSPLAAPPARGGSAGAGRAGAFSQRQIPTDVLPAQKSSSVTETGSQFALPPMGGEAEPQKKLELPPKRTLILAGITLLAAIFVLGSSMVRRQRQQEATDAAEAAHATAAASQSDEAVRARVREAVTQRLEAARQRERALLQEARERIEPVVAEAHAEAEEAAEDADDEAFDLEAEKARRARLAVQELAVDALALNDRDEALGIYLWLAESYEDEEVYGQMVEVLREAVR